MRLFAQDGQAVLEVCDDGRGGGFRDGAGLAGMRERLAALGGQLECKTDRGTRLRLRVPIVSAA